MKNFVFLIGLIILTATGFAQTVSYDSGYSTRRHAADHFYKMVTWDDSGYKEFTYSNRDAAGNMVEFMNWRAIFPAGYNKNNANKYPMIVMLHGAGESGRAWDGRYSYEVADLRYDNNGHNLFHGGQAHRDAVNRSPSNTRAFPGIVIFPQVSYSGNWEGGWEGGQLNSNGAMAVKVIEHMINNYQVDNNRIYLHGLSNGGRGTWDISSKRPDLFAAVLPMSAIASDAEAMTNVHVTTPFWQFQGGKDSNPTPSAALKGINMLIAKGGSPRYTLYPTLGHSTWNTAYAEPDFFSWILAQDKRKIYVFGGDPRLCQDETDTLKLGFSAGFQSYQWTFQGADIPGATGRYLKLAHVGTYTVKFMRSDNQWYESFPLEVTYKPLSQYSPAITNTGSVILPIDVSAKNVVDVNGPLGFIQYNWFKDGNKIATTTTSKRNISLNTGLVSDAGSYTLKIKEISGLSIGCQSQPSNIIKVVYVTPHIGPTPAVLNDPTALAPNQVSLTWTDSPGEEYYEVWRTRRTFNGYSSESYKMIAKLDVNILSFVDAGVRPFAQYRYRVRAIGGEDGKFSNEKTITMPEDVTPPTAPTDLQVSSIVDLKTTLSWLPSTDNDLLAPYQVFINSTLAGTTATNSFQFINLVPGSTNKVGVRAVDMRGNRSDTVSIMFYVPSEGLAYKYYEYTTSFTNVASFDFTVIPKKTGIANNFDISVRNRNDKFTFWFEGFIQIDEAGTYSFFTNSDDGSLLYINNTLVVNNDGRHSARERTGTYEFLSPGRYPIKVTYYDYSSSEILQVSYDPPGTAVKQLIPNNKLFQIPAPSSSGRISRDGAIVKTDDVEKAKVTAYPNPFIDEITVSRGSTDSREVRLYDHTGNIVNTVEFADGATETSMELRDVPKGIYFISVGNTRIRVLKKE